MGEHAPFTESKLKGEGRVYQDGNTEPSGTWKSSGMNQDTLNYDDNPQGPGGTDKGFTWHGGGIMNISDICSPGEGPTGWANPSLLAPCRARLVTLQGQGSIFAAVTGWESLP